MISFIFSFLFATNAMAIEVPRADIERHTQSVDSGPTTYKNFFCAHYPWHRAYLCEWKNRSTKEKHQLKQSQARNLLLLLLENGAVLKCRTSPWGEVCQAYFSKIRCDDELCNLRQL